LDDYGNPEGSGQDLRKGDALYVERQRIFTQATLLKYYETRM
jgi:hypothetical protein